jgi:hypothetical protein
MSDTQWHQLNNGETVSISRNGNHQYWIGDNGPKMRSVTGMISHIEGDTFGVGLNWGLKMVREHDGDLNAPRSINKESVDTGNRLHEAIDRYITNGTITEDPVFMSWYNELGGEEWLASEVFLYHPDMLYGGTADAISLSTDGTVTIFDWKTVDPNSWQKYGANLRINKDSAQLAAYASCLTTMGSVYAPLRGCVAYIMRDGSGVDVVEVDLERGSKLFRASRELFLLTTGSK